MFATVGTCWDCHSKLECEKYKLETIPFCVQEKNSKQKKTFQNYCLYLNFYCQDDNLQKYWNVLSWEKSCEDIMKLYVRCFILF